MRVLIAIITLFLLECAGANSMVGPGAVGSYTGRSRRRSYGTVRKEAEGFFIGGSALEDMNGVYERERDTSSASYLPFKLVYKHERSSWLIGVVRSPDSRTGDEWIIVDNAGEIRFKHPGGTIIPGCCKKWTRVRLKKDGNMYDDNNSMKDTKDVIKDNRSEIEDEFPWQVVFIGRQNMVQQLRNSARHTMNRRKRTLQGMGLPSIPNVMYRKQEESRPSSPFPCDGAPERVMSLVQTASDALEIRRNDNAEVMFEKALEHLKPFTKSFSTLGSPKSCVEFVPGKEETCRGNSGDDRECSDTIESERSGVCVCDENVLVDLPCGHKPVTCVSVCAATSQNFVRRVRFQWCEAALRVALAKTQRANRNVVASISNLETALHFFPRYKEALFEMGRSLLDQAGSAEDSLKYFETVLRLDRSYPELLKWMVRAKATMKRGVSHYNLLQIPMDFTVEDLRKAYRKMSKHYHPDRPGGSTEMFEKVSDAFKTLSDPKERELYDAGEEFTRTNEYNEKFASLSEETEKRYFPERYDYWPFGDPYEHRHRQGESTMDIRARVNRRRGRFSRETNLPLHTRLFSSRDLSLCVDSNTSWNNKFPSCYPFQDEKVSSMFHQFDTEMTFEELWSQHATRNITTEIKLEKLMISSRHHFKHILKPSQHRRVLVLGCGIDVFACVPRGSWSAVVIGSSKREDVVLGTRQSSNVERYVELNWNHEEDEMLRRTFCDEIEDLSFDAILIGPFGFPYMSNPRLVMSLLMRALKLEGMLAVTLGQDKALFDLRVVSLWQDVESGDVARALAVAYLHYAGLDHLNEYHDGNAVLSSVMVRGFKASTTDEKWKDKNKNNNVPFKSMLEMLIEEYAETKDDLSKIQNDIMSGMIKILENRRETELQETMRKYVKMTPQEREQAFKDLEKRREQLKKSEEIMEQMEETIERMRRESMSTVDRSRSEL